METETHSNNFSKRRVYAQTINISLGFAFWAYNFSIFNTLQEYIQTYVFPGASTSAMSWIASSLDAGAIVGALVGGTLVQKYGRRTTLLYSDVIGVVGASFTLIANLPLMILGRVISGIVGGINSVGVAMYLVEMSPVSMAGATGSMSIIILELMAFMSLAFGYALPTEEEGTGIKAQVWRILLFVPAFLNIIRFFITKFYFTYETPSYLIEKKKTAEAMESLQSVFTSGIEDEYARVAQDVYKATLAGSVRFRDLFTKTYRRALAVGMALAGLQTFSGSTAIFVFSNTILEPSTSDTVLFTTLISVVNLTAVIISFTFVEKLGRRTLILGGVICLGINVTAIGLVEVINGASSPVLKWLMMLWPVFYQGSIGSLTYLYISETLPDVGVSVCTAMNWTSGFIVSQFFLSVSKSLGFGAPFLAFGVACFAASYLFYGNLMETKGKTRSQIMFAFNRMTTLKMKNLDTEAALGTEASEMIKTAPNTSSATQAKSILQQKRPAFTRLPSMYMRDRRGTVWATPGRVLPEPESHLEQIAKDISEFSPTKARERLNKTPQKSQIQSSQSFTALPMVKFTTGKNGEEIMETVPDTEESFMHSRKRHRKSRSQLPTTIVQVVQSMVIRDPDHIDEEDQDSNGSDLEKRETSFEKGDMEEHRPITFRASP